MYPISRIAFWHDRVLGWNLDDPVEGAPEGEEGGIDNIPLHMLADRTEILKYMIEHGLGVYVQKTLAQYGYAKSDAVVNARENVNIEAGGLLSVDEVDLAAGDAVLLSGQTDRKENGLYTAEEGPWERLDGYGPEDGKAFTHEYIYIEKGEDAGKLFTVGTQEYAIGETDLEFFETAFSFKKLPGKKVIRDRNGNFEGSGSGGGDGGGIGIATEETVNGVLSSPLGGKISVAPDTGVMSLNGWKWLIDRIEKLEAFAGEGGFEPPQSSLPIADAGTDQRINSPESSVMLTGSGSSPDGYIVSTVWTMLSGPNQPTIVNLNSATTQVTGLIEGVYVFMFTVIDNEGWPASANVTVKVIPVSQAEFFASGVFHVPEGVTEVRVTACGAGGGAEGKPSSGGAGGGAAAIVQQKYTVTPDTNINVTVGIGGTGGYSTDTNNPNSTYKAPTSGGATIIGSLVTLPGGGKANTNSGGSKGGIGGGNGGNGKSGPPPGNKGEDGIIGVGGAGSSSPVYNPGAGGGGSLGDGGKGGEAGSSSKGGRGAGGGGLTGLSFALASFGPGGNGYALFEWDWPEEEETEQEEAV
ncbi:MAG: hypothetical protein LBH43_12950 [Treponema sp.]|jgi:hypothetical protein|nr:hypothetical protein [Treponema sp.]